MIDLSKVTEIKDIISNKVISKIQDELGNVIYELSKNLYDPNSPYKLNSGCIQGTGNYYSFPATKGGNRETYFFKCKPDTKYRLYCETVGDRLGIFGHNKEITPSLDMAQFMFSTVFKGSPTSGIVNEYTWTTKEDTIWCAIYWSVSKKPTGILIEEVKSEKTTMKITDIENLTASTLENKTIEEVEK